MGQTTSFNANLIKSNVLVMGTCELNGEAIYSAKKGKGMFTFMVAMILKIISIKLAILLLFLIYILILLVIV
jgi:hypothetical protein